MVSAYYFTYDGVFSGRYGLKIADFNDDPVVEDEAFSPALSTQKAPRQLRFYPNGITYDSLPAHEFTLVSEDIIPPEIQGEVMSWLIGGTQFKPLVFHQPDREPVTYYCIFTASNNIYINSNLHAFKLTATFDSQFCRGTPITKTVQSSGTITIFNQSDFNGYTYPTVSFTGDVSIVNTTDDAERAFTFSGLSSSLSVVVNNETKTITPSDGSFVLDKFTTKNWLRLRRGNNALQITCSSPVTIFSPNYKMIAF